jgi:hypothetical protein
MMETNTKSPAPAASKEEIGNALMMAAVNCSHAIDDDKVVLRRDTDKPGGSLRQLRERLVGAAPELVAAANESARNQRMFMAACEALGAINEKLGLDPDDGGADPIIEAIDQLQADLAAARQPEGEPLHDNLRDQIGQAINDAIAAGAPRADYCDSREVDRLADAVLVILPPLRTKDDATQLTTSATSLVELREHLHGAVQAGELIVLAPEAAGALVLAMSTGAPAGGAAPGCAKCGDVLPAGTYCKGIGFPLNPAAMATPPASAQAAGDAQALVDKIADMFSIGSEARKNHGTILVNLKNTMHFADLLHAVEREFFMVPAERDEDYPDEDPGQVCLVNSWGATTEQYLGQFRDALAQRAQAVAPAQVEQEPVAWLEAEASARPRPPRHFRQKQHALQHAHLLREAHGCQSCLAALHPPTSSAASRTGGGARVDGCCQVGSGRRPRSLDEFAALAFPVSGARAASRSSYASDPRHPRHPVHASSGR